MVRNELLLALPRDALDALLARAELVRLHPKQVLHERLKPITDVYFPEEGGTSVQIKLPTDQCRAGLGVLGRRGMLGLPLILGNTSSPLRVVVIQPGSAWRVSAEQFRKLLTQPAIAAVMLRYAQARLIQIAQLNLCNSSHSVEQRICRWLLVTSYLMDSAEICMSHEQVAQLISTTRPTATETLRRLQCNGYVDQRRSCITVLDSQAIEAASCCCHKQIIAEYERALTRSAPRVFA